MIPPIVNYANFPFWLAASVALVLVLILVSLIIEKAALIFLLKKQAVSLITDANPNSLFPGKRIRALN